MNLSTFGPEPLDAARNPIGRAMSRCTRAREIVDYLGLGVGLRGIGDAPSRSANAAARAVQRSLRPGGTRRSRRQSGIPRRAAALRTFLRGGHDRLEIGDQGARRNSAARPPHPSGFRRGVRRRHLRAAMAEAGGSTSCPA